MTENEQSKEAITKQEYNRRMRKILDSYLDSIEAVDDEPILTVGYTTWAMEESGRMEYLEDAIKLHVDRLIKKISEEKLDTPLKRYMEHHLGPTLRLDLKNKKIVDNDLKERLETLYNLVTLTREDSKLQEEIERIKKLYYNNPLLNKEQTKKAVANVKALIKELVETFYK